MVKAILPFRGAVKGNARPKVYQAGDTVSASDVQIGIDLGCVEREKPKSAPKTKPASQGEK